MREAEGGDGKNIQGLFSSDLHFLLVYVDVKDRWSKKLLGILRFIISFWGRDEWIDGWMDGWMDSWMADWLASHYGGGF